MTSDSLTSLVSLVGCAVLGLTPSFLSPTSTVSELSIPPAAEVIFEEPPVVEEMKLVQEQSVRQTLEVSELRQEIEDLHLLVVEQGPCPSCPR